MAVSVCALIGPMRARWQYAGKEGEKPFPMSFGRGFVVGWALGKRESMLDAGIELDLGIHSAFVQRLPQ